MELFQTLGAEIEKLWRDKNYDETLFPEIAANSLKKAALPEKITAWEVIGWTCARRSCPSSRMFPANSETRRLRFTILRVFTSTYFWLEGTTAIHQHAFCGAFQVLHGSSLHSWYDFDRSESVNAFTEIGNIKYLKLCETSLVGDVQPIWAVTLRTTRSGSSGSC